MTGAPPPRRCGVQFCPGHWRHVNMRKATLPRLYALLRHACYGSAAGSLPALLPLLTLLPVDVLGPQPDVLGQVLDSVWTGMQDASMSRCVCSMRVCAASPPFTPLGIWPDCVCSKRCDHARRLQRTSLASLGT